MDCESLAAMCSTACVAFVRDNLHESEVRGKSVLEVGSRNVSGLSVRPRILALGPGSYVGVDIEPGPEVDEICDAGSLGDHFGEDSFDVVIATELLEHVRDWRRVISNLKYVVRPQGKLVVTTRSYGFPYHGWPHDFWRYEPQDMKAIFRDFEIDALEPDLHKPGVFLKAAKPLEFVEVDLSDYELFSVVKRRRARSISQLDERVFALAYTPVRWARTYIPQPLKEAVRRTPLSREHRVVSRAAKKTRAA
jgi:SAM-dependent methyltransferase